MTSLTRIRHVLHKINKLRIPDLIKLTRSHRFTDAAHARTVPTRAGPGGRSSVSDISAVVFGATGFLGRYVVNRLGRMGSQIMIPYRGDVYDLNHLKVMGDLGQLKFRFFSLKEEDKLRELVKYSNVAINMIGRDYETMNFSFEDIYVKGPVAIARACKEEGVKRLIHVTALNASHTSTAISMRERQKGEEMVKEIFPDATFIRPSDIYGLEDRLITYYLDLHKLPRKYIPMLNRGLETFKYPVYVVDVAKAILKCVEDNLTVGKAYDIHGPEKYLLYDMVAYFYRAALRPFRPVKMPKKLFTLIGMIFEATPYYKYFSRDAIIRYHMSDILNEDNPGLHDLGITPTNINSVALKFIRCYRPFIGNEGTQDEVERLEKFEDTIISY